KIWSAENAQTTITGGIGANYDLSENWNIFANGLGNFADVSTNYYANVGLMYRFGCTNNKTKKEKSIREYLQDVQKELKQKDEEINNLKEANKEIENKEQELQLKEQEIQNKEQELENKELEIQGKEQEISDMKEREQELQKKINEYEAKVVSEQEAQKMKEKTIKSIRLEGTPTFRFGTAQLNNKGKESLKSVAKELEQYPDADILIEGHTDSIGKDDVNQKLSEERATAAAATLEKYYGVKNKISVIGKGEKEPIASNDTIEGRAKNRRVEIIITTAE
ncbi:MAG: OmpA family protein, partial [Elusimicrobia bacterium]|nr:OmpA family protein [Elusimicrobiota bacterium]